MPVDRGCTHYVGDDCPGGHRDPLTELNDIHRYLSTSCLHGDMVLGDGRTGHEYCRADTGHSGSKVPAQCKFCGAGCVCPCHVPVSMPDAGAVANADGRTAHPAPSGGKPRSNARTDNLSGPSLREMNPNIAQIAAAARLCGWQVGTS